MRVPTVKAKDVGHVIVRRILGISGVITEQALDGSSIGAQSFLLAGRALYRRVLAVNFLLNLLPSLLNDRIAVPELRPNVGYQGFLFFKALLLKGFFNEID